MERWLIVLSLAVMQCSTVAVASPDGHARLIEAVVTQQFAEQVGEQQAQEPAKSTGANAGCNTGRQMMAASYGKGQRTTASGERFNPHSMTAAHRTLPFGTRLTVTNLKTGKSVIVVINDRGPFTKRLDLDLSTAAAKAIGMGGIAAVCTE